MSKSQIVLSSFSEDMANIFGRSRRRSASGLRVEAAEPSIAASPGSDDDLDDQDEDCDDDEDPEDKVAEQHRVAAAASSFLSSFRGIGRTESRGGSRAPARTESRGEKLLRLSEGRSAHRPAPKLTGGRGSRISALIEHVAGIQSGIRQDRLRERTQLWAKTSRVAGLLGERFSIRAMDLGEANLWKASQEMKRLAEQAADVAIGLDEPEDDDKDVTAPAVGEEDTDALSDEVFKKVMAKILDALQLYNDVKGGDEDGGEPPPAEMEADEDPAAAADDDDDDDSDDDDDDDEEEPVAEQDGEDGGPFGDPDDECDKGSLGEQARQIRASLGLESRSIPQGKGLGERRVSRTEMKKTARRAEAKVRAKTMERKKGKKAAGRRR